jgi:hypothetical protein
MSVDHICWMVRWGPQMSLSGAWAAGVFWNNHDKAWRAAIHADAGDDKSLQMCLGCFVNEVDAALAYDQAAREYHKDKAQAQLPRPAPTTSSGLGQDAT